MTPREIELAIRRGEKAALDRFGLLDAKAISAMLKVYQDSAADLENLLGQYAAAGDQIQVGHLQLLLKDIQERMDTLSATESAVLNGLIDKAALIGADVTVGLLSGERISVAATDAVEYVRNLTQADGLGLSDRLWRVNRGAREAVSIAVQGAIARGSSAADAALDFVRRGVAVPVEVELALQAAGAKEIARTVARDVLVGTAETPRGAFAKSLRVMRTEMVRAYAAGYQRAAAQVDGVIGFKLNYSALHKEPCKCAPFVEQDVNGLGVGVFPVGHVPLPIHPNSRTYATAVFGQE